MRVSQRARMLDAGITTVHALAEHDGPVPELSARTVKALVEQARLQVADRMDGKPPYRVIDPQPLMVLPDADKGDLFFDFEGDPLWTVNGRDWGLEYLWGVLTTGAGCAGSPAADEFTPYWAHDRASERQALVDFLAMVRKRLKKYPPHARLPLRRLREEHAASGSPGATASARTTSTTSCATASSSTCIRWCARAFGSGARNYSIKSLEPLYMGNELRDGEGDHRDRLHHPVRQVLRTA